MAYFPPAHPIENRGRDRTSTTYEIRVTPRRREPLTKPGITRGRTFQRLIFGRCLVVGWGRSSRLSVGAAVSLSFGAPAPNGGRFEAAWRPKAFRRGEGWRQKRLVFCANTESHRPTPWEVV